MGDLLVLKRIAVFPDCRFRVDQRMEHRPPDHRAVHGHMAAAQPLAHLGEHGCHVRRAERLVDQPVFNPVDFSHIDHGAKLVVFCRCFQRFTVLSLIK
ncbi:hypothetical protein QW131_21235 [Roseibium salinum]|nr:hypothetical protein [Roseibium salinum]